MPKTKLYIIYFSGKKYFSNKTEAYFDAGGGDANMRNHAILKLIEEIKIYCSSKGLKKALLALNVGMSS